jgi:translation initiation factor IF-3
LRIFYKNNPVIPKISLFILTSPSVERQGVQKPVFDPIKNILNETDFLLAKVFRRSNQPVRKEPEAEHRLNALIRVPEVRLVGDNLEDLSALLEETIEVGVYPTAKALAWAAKAELDLVEITPNAVPPVCRITDYQKFLYQKKKREKEIKANTTKTVIKEIRFTTETGEHDIEFKVRHAIEFLKEGSKVKGYVQFKGRGITFQDRGTLLLLKFIQALDDYGTPEGLPKMEGKRMFVFLTPKKKSK